jgi:hypothetical protein
MRELVPPELSPVAVHILGLFLDCARGRQNNGWAWLPITWQEIMAWQMMRGISLPGWMADMFAVFDSEFLAAQGAKRGPDQNYHNGNR